ncbi:hypothetical protein [Crateriforma conspicua]|uniref:Tetratricopeptide repeat protein n=1 Tax=Crateriforma conspicua TaxID=2527996 RepID=A0A5C6FWH1_9PLAN|nr:hypothetical protein [Crateriforma conspicua]TWU65363.1 hypothetical protein V7x_09100 [Crateriforma conspicua]
MRSNDLCRGVCQTGPVLAIWGLLIPFQAIPVTAADQQDPSAAQQQRSTSDVTGQAQTPPPIIATEGALAPEQLSSDDYRMRQRTTLQMWRHRDATRQWVREAVRDPDPEVSGRAQWILDRWRRGILPDTPPELSKRLQEVDPAEAMDLLLKAGRFEAAAVALDESSGTPAWDGLRDRAATSIENLYPLLVAMAVSGDKVPDLVDLIDRVAESPSMLVCRAEVMQVMGMPVSKDTLLPDRSQRWSGNQQTINRIQVLDALGRRDDAIELAESALRSAQKNAAQKNTDRIGGAQAGPGIADDRASDVEYVDQLRELRYRCMALDGRWRELCEWLDEVDGSAMSAIGPPRSLSWTRHQSRRLVAAHRAGDLSRRQEAIDALTGPEWKTTNVAAGVDRNQAALIGQLRWGTLASCGEIDLAIEVLSGIDPYGAANLARASSRYQNVFKAIGLADDTDAVADGRSKQIARQLNLATRDWLERVASATEDSTADVNHVQLVIRSLLWCGRRDLAWQVCQELCRQTSIGRYPSRLLVCWSLQQAGELDWAVRFAHDPDDDQVSESTASVLASFFGDEGANGSMWGRISQVLALSHAGSSVRTRNRWTADLLRGRLPHSWDSAIDLDRFSHLLMTAPATNRRSRLTRSIAEPEIHSGYPLMFQRLGRQDLGDLWQTELVRRGDRRAMFLLAERQQFSGDDQTAATIYRKIFEQILHQVQTTTTPSPSADDEALAVRILAAQWRLAKQGTDASASLHSDQTMQLLLCSPQPRHRRRVIDYLVTHGLDAEAKAAYQRLLALTALDPKHARDFSAAVHTYAEMIHETRPFDAAMILDQAVVTLLDVPDRSEVTFVWYPTVVEGYRMQAAIDAGDEEAVDRSLAFISKLDPLAIDHVERLLPKAAEAGMDDLVTKTLDRIVDLGHQHFASYPSDAMMLNNLAWVLAVNDSQLSLAQQWASRAVRLEPDSAIYRDTLAEILYRQNKNKQAAAIEQACLLDTPADHHLHQQVARFRKRP